MTAEEWAEILDDFPSFCSFLEIRLKSGGFVRFNVERWHCEQEQFECERTGRDVVIKPRQIGFTTLELARDLWFAIVNEGVNVLVVVHDADLKEQLFLTLRVMAECLKRKGLLPKTRYSTKTELVFAETGSAVRIVEAGATVAAAQKKGRSGTIHRLHATEMAFWGQPAETWMALDAAVPQAAEVVIESTANGAGGLFYELVQASREGRGRYKCHFFPWYNHRTYRLPAPVEFDPAHRDKWERKLRDAGCDDQQIAWWRAKIDSPEWGLDKTLQEYPVDADSCFRVAGRQWFHPDVIDELYERVLEPLERRDIFWTDKETKKTRRLGELVIYETPVQAREYVIGGDVSEGTGSDAHDATVMDTRTARTVAKFWADNIEPGDFGLALAVIGEIYNWALVAPERNNHGHAALRALIHEARYPYVYRSPRDEKYGWLTDNVTRPVMIDDLGSAIRTKTCWTPDRSTAGECKTLVRNDKGKVEARGKGTKDGAKDDRWMSWCIAFAVRSQPSNELQRVHIPGF